MIGEIDDSKAPLLDHLIELRSRLLKCVYALVITGALCFYFSEQLFAILVHPLKEAFGDAGGKLVYTKLYEAFFVQVKIAFFGAFCLSFPIIANQLWAFVAPGLYAREKKALLTEAIARVAEAMDARRSEGDGETKRATDNLRDAVRRKAENPTWTGPEDRTADQGPIETPNTKIAPSGALHAEGMRAAISRSTGNR